jgi:hypothetical protein
MPNVNGRTNITVIVKVIPGIAPPNNPARIPLAIAKNIFGSKIEVAACRMSSNIGLCQGSQAALGRNT